MIIIILKLALFRSIMPRRFQSFFECNPVTNLYIGRIVLMDDILVTCYNRPS